MPAIPVRINVKECISTLAQTPAGEQALAALWQGLIEWGEEVSNHENGEQAQALTHLVAQSILYGDFEAVANAIKEDARQPRTEITEEAARKLLARLPTEEDAGS